MSLIETTEAGACRIIRLARPVKLNALSGALLDALEAALEQAEASASRGLIVTGAGERAFCAGADLAEVAAMSADELDARNDRARALFDRLSRSRLVSIAAINADAFGGGLELALACTFRVAARGARLGLPEVTLGVVPTYGGTQRLPRLVGSARALELMLSGRAVTAEEAGSIGLVDRVSARADDIVTAALEFLAPILPHSLPALAHIKAAVLAGAHNLTDGLHQEGVIAREACRSRDAREGIGAFLAKRTPQFQDA